MVVGRRDTWFVSARKDEGKAKIGVGKKVEIMMIRVRQIHKLAPEAGMFIKAKVNGVNTNLLIDTGAKVTLISTSFFKDMNNMPTLSHHSGTY